jgi:predicted acylesterase/phospholipase RssA
VTTSRPVTLVLGGGGAKAAAHVGAWQAVTEAGLTPVHYCGTSMGAVIAAALAAGLTPADVGARMAGVRAADVARPRRLAAVRGLTAPSLFYIEPLRGVIEGLVPVRSFAQLSTPLNVTAVNADTGELVMFGPGGREAPLIDALLASCALPVFYQPVTIEGTRFVDGGVRAVLPLECVASTKASLVVAVDTGPGFDDPPAGPSAAPALLEAHNSMTGMLMASNTRAAVALWRATPGLPRLVYVRPRVEKHVTFRVDLAGKYVEEGYRATQAALGAIDDWKGDR